MIEIRFTPTATTSQLTLQLGAADGGAAATPMEGARSVFETEQDDDDDLFKPVRGTNGTVHFYNEGNAWDDLAFHDAEEHIPVVLRQGGGALWKGYVNKGYAGTRRIFGYDEECDVSVQCPLMELDTMDYDPLTMGQDRQTGDMITLAGVLSDLTDDPFGDGVMSAAAVPAGDVAVNIMANVYVPLMAFYEENEDDNGVTITEPKYTMKEALEEVMRMLCCSARWTGTAVVIEALRPDDSTASALTFTPADRDSEETAVMPFRKIRVTAAVDGKANDEPVSIPTQDIQRWIDQNNTSLDLRTVLTFSRGISEHYAPQLIYGSQGVWQTYEEWRHVDDTGFEYRYEDADDAYATIIGYAQTSQEQADMRRLTPAVCLHDYPFDQVVSHPAFDGANVVRHTLKVQSARPLFASRCYLDLKIRLNMNLCPDKRYWDYGGMLDIYIEVGDMAFDYDMQQWGYRAPNDPHKWFSLEYADGELVKPATSDWYYEQPDGVPIPVLDTNLGGIVVIGIKTNEADSGQLKENCIITVEQLSLKVLSHIERGGERDTYTATGRGTGIDEQTLAFCSRRTVNGRNGLYYLSQGSGYFPVVTAVLDGGSKRPEQWVADRHAAMCAAGVRSLLTVHHKGSLASGRYSFNNKNYQTIAISHEWAEDIAIMQLVETDSKETQDNE